MSSPERKSFADLAIAEPVLLAVQAVGYEYPSPIQAAAIPVLLSGKDLLGVAQTGTGKTAAFALPLLSGIDLANKKPQVLVLTPTRELAIQVAEAFQKYATHLKGFHVLPIYGGQDMGLQLRNLKRGAQVIVGTPGRVIDHLKRSSLQLDGLKALVLDEADEMLRMGFIDDVEWILQHTPEQRQVALFSATMPAPIRKVADRYLKSPTTIRIESETTTAEHIEQSYLDVKGPQKLEALTRILEAEPFDGMLIFVRTKTATVELAEKLEARGYSAAALNGDMSQPLRERTIDRIKKSQVDIVVATDVAARGIDVERISHVLNYDIPYDSEAYVHRIGRTGRAGRAGKAILFVAPRERHLLRIIEKATRQPIKEMKLPSGELVTQLRIDQFKQTITTTIEQEKLDFFHQLLGEYSVESNYSAEDIACALAFIVQKERPLQVRYSPDKSRSRDDERTPGSNKGARRNDANLQSYRLEVGRRDGVKPGDIVGAIANEANIDSQNIGHIKLFDDFVTVDLPSGMPPETLEHLRNIRIKGKPLLIREYTHNDSDDSKKKPRKKHEKKPSIRKRAKSNAEK